MMGNCHASLWKGCSGNLNPASLLLFMEVTMKKLTYALLLLIVMFTFSCSKDDDNDTPTDVNIYGYKLDQFVPQNTVHDLITTDAEDLTDYRSLFAYEIVSADEDEWSPRLSVNAGYDLGWNAFKEGFYVPSDNKKTWFADTSLPSAFKVRNTGKFNLYRKVDVVTTRSTKMVELKGLTTTDMTNWSSVSEAAVKLSDLLEGIGSYTSVKLVAGDDYSVTYTPEQIQDGYYFLSSEVTTFPSFNATMSGSQKKFKRLARIEVTTADEQVHTFANAPHDKVSISFSVPADLAGYTSTVMTNY